MKSKFIKKIGKSSFVESFRKPKALFYNVLLDIAIIIVVIFILRSLSFILLEQSSSLLGVITPTLEKILSYVSNPGKDISINDVDLFNIQFVVKVFLKIAITLFLSFIVLVIIISAFKSLQFSVILKQKINKSFFIKFILTDLVWHLLWLALIIVTAFIFKIMISAYLILIEIVLFLYFTGMLHSIFDKDKKIFGVMKEAIKIGISKFYYFILPAIIIIALSLALFYIFTFLLLIKWDFLIFVMLLVALFYISWIRIYFSLVSGKVASKC